MTEPSYIELIGLSKALAADVVKHVARAFQLARGLRKDHRNSRALHF